jgi:polar amino acid transport system substrate-binding protein
MDAEILSQLAPGGTLRAGLNMANGLLITGSTPDGEPDGVAPDMARELARRLGVPVTMVPFASPGEVADAGANDVWTYLVPAGSALRTIEAVDRSGIRIAVSGRSAYDLYLSRNLEHAELVRAKGLPGAMELFAKEGLDAVAGLRPALVDEAAKLPGSRVLDGKFTAVQQAIGTQKGKDEAFRYLRAFVEEAKASGLVARLIERHGVTGRLSVAAAE